MKRTKLFIAHASEDKDDLARPLAAALNQRPGVEVWYDEYSLFLGDSLLTSISKGLRECDFGIVVFSPSFFLKKWPQTELAGLFARETIDRKLILPVWHEIGREEILAQYPPFADRIASKSSDGIDRIITEILKTIQASQRTQEINNPIFNAIETLADKVTVRTRSDQLLGSQEGIARVWEEVQRLFNLFESYFEPQKAKLGIEIVRDDNATSIIARTVRFALIDRQKSRSQSRKARIAFSCEYPIDAKSSLRDASLKLTLYREIFDSGGKFQEAAGVHDWEITPIFTALEQVVWTNRGPVQEMTTEDLLNWTLAFFLDAIAKSTQYDRYD